MIQPQMICLIGAFAVPLVCGVYVLLPEYDRLCWVFRLRTTYAVCAEYFNCGLHMLGYADLQNKLHTALISDFGDKTDLQILQRLCRHLLK